MEREACVRQVEDLLVSIMHCRSESLIADSGTKDHNGPAKKNFREILLGIRQLDEKGFKRSKSWLSKVRKTEDEKSKWNFCFELEISDRSM